jgi:DNA polymerase-3 subunit epsilon
VNTGLALYRDKLLRRISAPKQGAREAAAKGPKGKRERDGTLAIDKACYVVVDTELTGLSPQKDSIVSLGAVKMVGSRIDVGNYYYRVVEPKTRLTGQSVIIHSITPTEAAECPAIEVLLPEFLGFCGDSVLVGHFVSIDLKFINREMGNLYGAQLKNRVLDTLKIYHWIKSREEQFCAYHCGDAEDTSLTALAKKYGIPVSGAHNALSDAFVTAQLFQRFIPMAIKLGIRTLDDLIRIGRP